jgi:hypothetical protein
MLRTLATLAGLKATKTRIESMPTARRILRFAPAVLLVAICGAWIASWFGAAGVAFVVPVIQDEVQIEIQGSTVEFALNVYYLERPGAYLVLGRQLSERTILGFIQFRYHMGLHGRPVLETEIPLSILATLVLPLAIGPFLSFRFRLWHCLAYTALVALQLAYYLRWQD